MFEIAQRRKTLSSLDLDGTTRPQPATAQRITELYHGGFTVKLFDCQTYIELGTLSTSMTELLAHSLRHNLNISTTAFLNDYLVTNRTLSQIMKW